MERIFYWASLLLFGALLGYLATAATRSWLVGLPCDYFTREPPHHSSVEHVLRMILGGALIVFGIVMLVTPGPGILTIVAGLLVTDGGGKQAMLRKLVQTERVASAVDALRRSAGQPPLVRP